jgi:hypothetical protein
MAAQKEKKDQRFDPVKLQGMHEPLSIRVEKIRGNVRQPIELPPKGNEQQGYSPPGAGWTRDEVLQLENFVLTKWAGGGYYEFTVTDAKNDQMTWQGVWDPRMYPEKIPPNTAEAALIGATQGMPTAGPQPVPTVVQPLGLQPQSGWPPSSAQLGYGNPPFSGPVMPQPQQNGSVGTPPAQQLTPSQAPPMWAQPAWPMGAGPMAQFPNGPWGYPQMGYPQMGYGNPFGMPSFGPSGFSRGPRGGYGGYGGYDDEEGRARRARLFDQDDEKAERAAAEKRDLEQRLRQAELTQKEMEYKAQLDRIQQQQQQQLQQQQAAQAQQVAAMQEEIRRLADARGKGEDEETRRLREEAQRQREAQQAEIQRERERAAAEKAALERQIADQQLAQMRAHADQQIAQMRAQSEAQIQLLRDQLARMSEQPRGETEEFRRLREEQERQAREHDRQRQEDQRRLEQERYERERERERADRERREENIQREMREARAETERRFEQMMNARNASDPMIDALKETSRMNAEQMREMARMQQAQSDKMAAFMVAPAQLAAIMKDNSTGADGVMRGMIQSIGEIGNLYKNAAQSVMEMSGGGGEPPAVRLIQEGMARAGEVAERFLAVKRDSVISEAKVKQAEAARDQTKIQAEAQLRAQQMYTQAQAQQQRWATPPPVASANGASANARPAQPQQAQQAPQAQPQQPPQQAQAQPVQNAGGGLGGAASQPQPQPKRQPGQMIEYVEPAAQAKPSGMIEYVEPAAPPTRTGPTEEEVFGMALESVHRLRRGVAEGSLTPDKTIDAILKGVEHVISNQLVIPAFVLFQQERWADFIDLMLPAAPQEFRDECVSILINEVEPADPDDPADPQTSSALVPSGVS